MKQAWNDLKSFITVAMILLLFIIVIANLLGANLAENLLILVTNLSTAVFTYYFTKKKEDTTIVDESKNIEEGEDKNNEK